ncbi:MAG: ribose 5-phosphate isomerase B [Dehalococcoidia bacterium]|jgi:ribose 5-phosphate isomerase B|nr:ribose 5-phosphate isomerase B [Dehalococcoidia bacterium]
MRIAIGSDHAGFALKEILREELEASGDEIADYGTDSEQSCDYPDIAIPLAQAVARGEHEIGVLICSNGVGPSIVANKVAGVRAALCHDTFSARRARKHTDANVLCMGAWAIGRGVAAEVLSAFRDASFEGGRHEARVAKINALDRPD